MKSKYYTKHINADISANKLEIKRQKCACFASNQEINIFVNFRVFTIFLLFLFFLVPISQCLELETAFVWTQQSRSLVNQSLQ